MWLRRKWYLRFRIWRPLVGEPMIAKRRDHPQSFFRGGLVLYQIFRSTLFADTTPLTRNFRKKFWSSIIRFKLVKLIQFKILTITKVLFLSGLTFPPWKVFHVFNFELDKHFLRLILSHQFIKSFYSSTISDVKFNF